MKQLFTFTLICLFAVTTLAGPKEAKIALDREDFKTAYKEYLALAEKGDAEAMFTLGLLFQQGDGRTQDYTQAMDWYLKAFAKQNGDAFNTIGEMYRDGLGIPQNLEIAYALFWITHWQGLGSETTQIRNGRNLDNIATQLTKPQLEETLKMTREYVVAYVENRGKLTPEQEQLKYAATGHPIKALAETGSQSRENQNLRVELRLPKAVPFDEGRAVEFVTSEGVVSSPIKSLKRREEQSFVILSASFLSFGESRHAVMVRTSPSAPTQVFQLPKTSLKPSDWTAWGKPNYVETSDAAWTFMTDYKNAERSTTLPSNCFEMRYKVEPAKKKLE
ncbi:MAG: hypothetical protein JWM68_2662 [Verrucomicrobiales bacterium]|nr:hypothetical protein [Verrucomicrobiales bacterium]